MAYGYRKNELLVSLNAFILDFFGRPNTEGKMLRNICVVL